MYSDYMAKKIESRQSSWLNKDSKGRLFPVDDSWHQLYQNTENSENLENIDEEFFQRKPKKQTNDTEYESPSKSMMEEMLIEVEVKLASPKKADKNDEMKIQSRPMLTKITEMIEE